LVTAILFENLGQGWSRVGERRLPALAKGASVVFQRTAPGSGEARFEASIVSPIDPPPFDRDDSLRATCRVDERQRVIWLYPSSRAPDSIPGSTERFTFEPRAWPASEEDLASAEVLVIADLRAEELEAAPLPLERWVAREGRGLLVLGGPRTLGPGGWAGRPIEEWLPIRCTPPEDEGADLWLVVDRLGSMAGEPLDQARRAIRSVVRGAAPGDGVWAAGFAEGLDTPVRLKAPGEDLDVGRVGAWLAGLEARGSTALVAALEELESRLPSSTSRRRHVLVLSDGKATGDDPESRLPALGRRLGRDDVAVSVHAAGNDPDRDLLERLVAAGAGGRYSAADDIESLPDLFLSEVRRDWIRNGPIAVRDRDGRPLPELSRLVRTDARQEAEIELVSEDGDPVLATVRRGVGQVGVFTSGGAAGWADAWQSGPLWDRLLTAVAPPSGTGWSVAWRRLRGGLELDVRSPEPLALDSLRVSLDGASPVALLQVSPSSWQGELELQERRRLVALDVLTPSGDILLRRRLETGGDEELIRLGPDMHLLERIAQVTGGEVRPIERRESDLPGLAGPSRLWAIALAAIGILALLAARHRPRG
ncbi:MAG: vWA domain-containing protein, partial [Planctomycetota bacterium]